MRDARILALVHPKLGTCEPFPSASLHSALFRTPSVTDSEEHLSDHLVEVQASGQTDHPDQANRYDPANHQFRLLRCDVVFYAPVLRNIQYYNGL